MQQLSIQLFWKKLRNADDLEHFRRGAPDSENMMDELRAVFGRVDDEPLPDFSNFRQKSWSLNHHQGRTTTRGL